MSDVMVKLEHLRSVPGLAGKPGYCSTGARRWFDARRLPWRTFVREGLPASQLRATGDALALRLVEHAELMEANRGR